MAASSAKTLYMMMVRTLQQEILQGIYPVGTAIPSEAMLAKRFGVSRHTVREALRTMRDAGLVTSRKGFGTLVRRPGERQGYVHQVNTIEDLFPVNVETRYDPVDGSLIRLPEWAKLVPELDDNRTWLKVAGVRLQPGQTRPFNELDVFVVSRFAGVGRAVGVRSGPVYGIIETIYGEAIGEVTQIFAAFKSDGVLGKALGMKRGDVGMEIRRLYRLASDNSVAMVSFNRYLPDAFSFSMTLRRVRE